MQSATLKHIEKSPYDYNFRNCNNRGAYSAVFSHPEHDNAMIMISCNPYKVAWLEYLGVLVEKMAEYRRYNRTLYVYSVVKLESVTWQEYDDYFKKYLAPYRELINTLRGLRISNDAIAYNVYMARERFGTLATLIEYVYENYPAHCVLDLLCDCGSRNMLKCPVTGIIYPYDIFNEDAYASETNGESENYISNVYSSISSSDWSDNESSFYESEGYSDAQIS